MDHTKQSITGIKVGIIGGSGLDDPAILGFGKDIDLETPYGRPSSPLKIGKISNMDVVLLARHARDHSIMPSNVNNQANIWALKELGCTHIIASTACGSLQENIKPGDFIFINQFIDRTQKRKQTMYESGSICHIPMAEPFCPQIRSLLANTAAQLQVPFHESGTVVTIEGPRFSTKAESKMFQSWGADVINMSTVPEVVLAREAGICYAAVAMATDYDCWRESTEAVSWEQVLSVFHLNVEKIIKLLVATIPRLEPWQCRCQQDILHSIMNKKEMDLKKYIRTVPHWPKPGIMFRDITTLLQNPQAFEYCISTFQKKFQHQRIDKIAGIESRGFIFGAALAAQLRLPFVPIRKKGKLPWEVVSHQYTLEYGTDTLEMHKDAVLPHEKVLIIDDLLATGGTALAACELVEKLQGEVIGTAFVINLVDLGGSLTLSRYNPYSLIEYEGE